MNCWRIGSNWGTKNVLNLFKKTNVVFAGSEVKNLINKVKKGDLIVVTNRNPFVAVGKVDKLIDLSTIEGKYDIEYEGAQAIKMETLYFKEDFPQVEFSAYEGQGTQFRQAHNNYIKKITTLYNQISHIVMENKYTEQLIASGNLILTGAPGTGKTYLARKMARTLILTPEKEASIEETAFQDYRNFSFEPSEVVQVDEAWRYWKGRIRATDFNLDDFANIIGNVADQQIVGYGSYLMNFLERTSSKIYGSSKPGSAFRYGIKMNDDLTYGFGDSPEKHDRITAEKSFNELIKPWLQEIIHADFEQQMELVEQGHELIRAGQLMRKIIVLEHPSDLLTTYQDETISKAYKYFVNGTEGTYFKQNRSLLEALYAKFKLKHNKESQFKLQRYIWHYFSTIAGGDLEETKAGFIQTYLNDYSDFVQFHPSYDYTDFFDGLRPVRKDDQKEIGFELKNGSFKSFCMKAKKALKEDRQNKVKTERKFIFIIDEINRAEIAKVFGELFFAIDPGYRGETGMVKTQYSNIQTEKTYFTNLEDDRFYVPENVYIIGTMNDIDRSVESFDFAMRRRFAWMEITAEERKGMWDGQIEPWKKVAGEKMDALNKAIDTVSGLTSSYAIGPAYFLKLNESKGDFNQLWQCHIGVIIKEYLRGMPNAADIYSRLKESYDNPLVLA